MNRILINHKLKEFKTKTKRKEFLINCIHNHKPMTLFKEQQQQQQEEEKNIIENYNKVCENCGKFNFINTKFEEICQLCGVVRVIQGTKKTFSENKIENIVEFNKKTNKILVDIKKLDLWLEDNPLAKDFKLINDTIDSLEKIYDIDTLKNTCRGLFYYSIDKLKKVNKELKNRKGFIGLCIHYSGLINDIHINIKTISEKLDINIVNIYKSDDLFQELFQNTGLNYLKLQLETKCNIELNKNNEKLFNIIKSHLVKESIIKEPIENKYYSAIIYYISKNINTSVKYTLQDLHKNCKVSTTLIGETNKKIEQFYKKHTDLLETLKLIKSQLILNK